MRHRLERLEPLVDLWVIESIDAFRAKFLDVERRHHRTVNHRPPHRFRSDLILRSEIAHEPAGERIARTGRVKDAFERIRRHNEVAVFGEQRRSVLAAFDNNGFRAELHDFACRHVNASFLGQLPRLGVVDDDAIDDLDRLDQGVLHRRDPKIHRVHRHEFSIRHLFADLLLQHRQDVCEEEQLGGLRIFAQFRIECLEHIKLRVQRMRRVHVVIVTPAPKERFALGHDLDVVSVDVVAFENRPFLITKIPADHADRVHLCKKRSRQPKMRRRPAQNPIPRPKRRLQSVKRHAAYNC